MRDENRPVNYIVICNIIFAALVFAVCFYLFFFTDMQDSSYRQRIRDFSDDWQTTSGEMVDTDSYTLGDSDGMAQIVKLLPGDITESDNLCFESVNVNIKAYIDDEPVYSYMAKENLSGMGYGSLFHTIGLSPDMGGKPVRIIYSAVTTQSRRGRIRNVYLGPAADFIHLSLEDNRMSIILTILIIFFGCILILVWAGTSNKSELPVDILDMGLASVLMGFWLLANTNMMQLLTGKTIFWRVIDRLASILAMYPFIRFFNSITRLKRKIYVYLAFLLTTGLCLSLIISRYAFGIDTLVSFPRIQMIMVLVAFIIVAVMQAENFYYCRKNSLPLEHKGTYLGMAALFICGFMETILYLSVGGIRLSGTIIIFGMLFFVVTVLLQFINWWIRDQAAVDRDRFVNRSLQFAVSSRNPVESIRLLLEYMGKELGAKRTAIFEANERGDFACTYEWYQEGQYPLNGEQTILPLKGFIDQIYDSMFSKEQYVMIEDVEKIQTTYPQLYQRLKNLSAMGLVAGPLKSEDRLIGIFCVGDIAPEHYRNITEIMGIISYFFAQFINQRKEQERMLFYSYHDPLSTTKNRSALKEFTDQKLDMSQAFGYVICEILGLKEINVRQGHDAGDEIVVRAAKCLMDAFGESNVYRISGEEFVCFGFESDETFFENDVERARRLFEDNKVDAAMGAVYCSNGTTDLKNVAKYAHSLLEKAR